VNRPASAGARLNEGLSAALNRVVGLDEEARRGLRKLEGRALGLRLLGPGLSLTLAVEDGRFGPLDDDGDADAWIETTPGMLLGLAARGGRAASGQLSITGNADTAQRFQAFFTGLRPDWEEGLTRVFGDILGVQIARLLTGAFAQVRRTGESLGRDVGDYLRDESGSLVHRAEVDEFLDAVDDLRDDLARLERRVRGLQDAS